MISLLVTAGPVLVLAEVAFVANQRWIMAAVGAALLIAFALAMSIAGQLSDAEQPGASIDNSQSPERARQASRGTAEL